MNLDDADHQPRHRSGAVARMLRMPVATLRVWERRYRVAAPALTPSGQRLYSGADVQRLALLKQLTDLGHAIGSLAALDMTQLQAVAATHARTIASTADPAAADRPWQLAVVGAALAQRLRRPTVSRAVGRVLEVLGPYADPGAAAAALGPGGADALLLQRPSLQPSTLAELDGAAAVLGSVPRALFFRFGSDALCEALDRAGVALLREPQPDAVLGQWLGQWADRAAAARRPGTLGPTRPSPPVADAPLPPRRWDDATLSDLAGLSTTIACECPRHLAELLIQLSHFEAYSADCRQRSPADAELHAYLQQVTAHSRAHFEDALARVAQHEGLLLG